MHHILLLLLGICSVIARPSKELEMMLSSDYKLLNDALQQMNNNNDDDDQDIYQHIPDEDRFRLHHKMNALTSPIKRIPRIGGTIVMGRRRK
ncbi:hypothetical protein Q1695_004427 [Nippostrongylus brasiliensis]|nr:hypothetical protein Q1695_004427 [Nippostrongylus brasiliensis]